MRFADTTRLVDETAQEKIVDDNGTLLVLILVLVDVRHIPLQHALLKKLPHVFPTL